MSFLEALKNNDEQEIKRLKEENNNNIYLEAAFKGNLELIKKLESKEVLEKLKDEDGRNALHYAASGGNNNVILYLLKTVKMDINSLDSEGSKAIHYAEASRKKDTVKFLKMLGPVKNFRKQDTSFVDNFIVKRNKADNKSDISQGLIP